jgi:hypothetical protein
VPVKAKLPLCVLVPHAPSEAFLAALHSMEGGVPQPRAAKWIKPRGAAGRRGRSNTALRSETALCGLFHAPAQRPARTAPNFLLRNHHDLGVFLSHNEYNR